jgi:hypothetical protein
MYLSGLIDGAMMTNGGSASDRLWKLKDKARGDNVN